MDPKSIFFLKTSKTGSTTLMSIFQRYGLKYGLSFLLGQECFRHFMALLSTLRHYRADYGAREHFKNSQRTMVEWPEMTDQSIWRRIAGLGKIQKLRKNLIFPPIIFIITKQL